MSTSRLESRIAGGLLAVALIVAVAGGARSARAATPETLAVVPPPPPRWVLGPEISLGVPQPLMLGIEAHSPERPELRGFLEVGWFRYPLIGGPRNVHIESAQIGIRWFPTSAGRGWYLAPSLGYRHAAVSTTLASFQLDDSVTINDATISASTLYFGLTLGANVRISRHLYWGMDLGVQVALTGGGNLGFHSDNPSATADPELLNPDTDALDRIGRLLVPQLTLFRLVWMLD